MSKDSRYKWYERAKGEVSYKIFYFENGEPRHTGWMTFLDAGFRYKSLIEQDCEITRIDKQTRDDAMDEFR